MHTDSITIGRDPFLTYAVVQAIAKRKERQDRRKAIIKKLTFWKHESI